MRLFLILAAAGAVAWLVLRKKPLQPGFVRVSPNTTTPPPDSLVEFVTSGQLNAYDTVARAERERKANEARQAAGDPRKVFYAGPTRAKDDDATRPIGSVMPVENGGWVTWDGTRWQETSTPQWTAKPVEAPTVESIVQDQVDDALSTIKNFFAATQAGKGFVSAVAGAAPTTIKRTASV